MTKIPSLINKCRHNNKNGIAHYEGFSIYETDKRGNTVKISSRGTLIGPCGCVTEWTDDKEPITKKAI